MDLRTEAIQLRVVPEQTRWMFKKLMDFSRASAYLRELSIQINFIEGGVLERVIRLFAKRAMLGVKVNTLL